MSIHFLYTQQKYFPMPDKPKKRIGRVRSFQFYPADDDNLGAIKEALNLPSDVDALREALRQTAKNLGRRKPVTLQRDE